MGTYRGIQRLRSVRGLLPGGVGNVPDLDSTRRILLSDRIDSLTDDEILYLTHIKRGGGWQKGQEKRSAVFLKEVIEGVDYGGE